MNTPDYLLAGIPGSVLKRGQHRELGAHLVSAGFRPSLMEIEEERARREGRVMNLGAQKRDRYGYTPKNGA